VDVRYFSPEEAAAALPQVRPLLAALRDAFHAYRFAREQHEELVAFGEAQTDEAAKWRREAEAQAERVQALVDEIGALGADVKDPLLGLIDFYHKRADGTIVLLCYRDDEDALRFWHPLDTGFAGRRPLDEL